MKRVLWIGPVIKPEDISKHDAVSPAANKWQYEFIQSLMRNGVDVINVSYITERTWPFGKLWIVSKNSGVHNLNQILIDYLNIKLIREYVIALKVILKVLKPKKINIEYVITYNEILRHKVVAYFLNKFFGIKWISILADGKTSGNANLVLFLSEDYYNRYNGKKYFLDGGLERMIDFSENKNDNYFLYAGSMTKITGLEEFIKIYLELGIDNELHLYGKPTERIMSLVNNHSKIKIKGFVTDEELHKACCNAFAFINPRGDNSEALNTFPSKLLLYLKYGKPIISYKFSGISKKYDGILLLYDSKMSLKSALTRINEIDKEDYYKKIKKLQENNSWDAIVNRFIKYVEKCFLN